MTGEVPGIALDPERISHDPGAINRAAPGVTRHVAVISGHNPAITRGIRRINDDAPCITRDSWRVTHDTPGVIEWPPGYHA